MTNHMPVMSGRINILPSNTQVSVLRDRSTGCSICVIKSSLVKPERMTGGHSKVTLIDGSLKDFPVAKIGIDSPFVSGEIQAWCMPECLCEVVIGNILGARAPNDPNLEWMPKDPVIPAEIVQISNHHSLPKNEQVEL